MSREELKTERRVIVSKRRKNEKSLPRYSFLFVSRLHSQTSVGRDDEGKTPILEFDDENAQLPLDIDLEGIIRAPKLYDDIYRSRKDISKRTDRACV